MKRASRTHLAGIERLIGDHLSPTDAEALARMLGRLAADLTAPTP